MIELPPGEPQEVCAICGEPFERYDPNFASGYANLVCRACGGRAVTERRDRPKAGNEFFDRETSTTDEEGNRVIRMGP